MRFKVGDKVAVKTSDGSEEFGEVVEVSGEFYSVRLDRPIVYGKAVDGSDLTHPETLGCVRDEDLDG